jgi:hypothetical protein
VPTSVKALGGKRVKGSGKGASSASLLNDTRVFLCILFQHSVFISLFDTGLLAPTFLIINSTLFPAFCCIRQSRPNNQDYLDYDESRRKFPGKGHGQELCCRHSLHICWLLWDVAAHPMSSCFWIGEVVGQLVIHPLPGQEVGIKVDAMEKPLGN